MADRESLLESPQDGHELSVNDGELSYSEFVASPRRYLILFLLCISSCLSAYVWICFAPIQPTVSSLFEASALQINVISAIFYISYLPASILGTWLMERHGLRTTLVWGAGFNGACAILKWAGSIIAVSNPQAGYYTVLGGQILGSIGQPLIVNPVPRLSADWFGDKERDLATVISTQTNIFGQLLGSLLPPLIVSDAKSLQMMGLVQAVIGGVVLLVSVLFLKDRPDSPPSASTAAQWQERDDRIGTSNFPSRLVAAGASSGKVAAAFGHASSGHDALAIMWKDSSALLRNRDFNLLNLGFSIATGMAWTLLTVESQLLSPCGYSDDVAGISGAALLALGIVVAFAAAPVMQRTRAYNLLQKVVMGLCAAATVFVLAVNRPGNSALVIGAWLILGAWIQPLLPLTLEHAAEMTYPVPADVSSAVLQTCANIVATIQTFAITPLLDLKGSSDCSTIYTPTAAFVLSFMVLGFLVTLPVRKLLKRQEAESVR